MRHDDAREAAVEAAAAAMDGFESNMLVRHHLWRVVNVALDTYDHRIQEALQGERTRTGWVVLHENGLPWLVLPTYRLARQQRAVLAQLSGCFRHRLRIVRTEVVPTAAARRNRQPITSDRESLTPHH